MYAFHLGGHFLARTGKPVQRLALVLCGGIRRNRLFRHLKPGRHFSAGSLLQRGAFGEILLTERRFADDGTFRIPGVGGHAEAQRAAVGLDAAFQKIPGKLGGVAEEYEQHSRGHGVERAGVADFLLPQAFDPRDALCGAEPFGLVEYQYAVLLFHAKDVCTFNCRDSPAPDGAPAGKGAQEGELPE